MSQISREALLKNRLRFTTSGWVSYNKLSDVESRQIVHILEKSKFFKSYVKKKCCDEAHEQIAQGTCRYSVSS